MQVELVQAGKRADFEQAVVFEGQFAAHFVYQYQVHALLDVLKLTVV